MSSKGFHLAQINIGRIRAPLEDPQMAGFVTNLDAINAVAERSPGFVWRFQTEEGNATSVSAFTDPMVLINITVWETPDDLFNYVYRSDHTPFLKQRKEWFEPYNDGPYMALWWIEAGHIPSVVEAKEKLEYLAEHGPTPEAFTFKTRFPTPETSPYAL